MSKRFRGIDWVLDQAKHLGLDYRHLAVELVNLAFQNKLDARPALYSNLDPDGGYLVDLGAIGTVHWEAISQGVDPLSLIRMAWGGTSRHNYRRFPPATHQEVVEAIHAIHAHKDEPDLWVPGKHTLLPEQCQRIINGLHGVLAEAMYAQQVLDIQERIAHLIQGLQRAHLLQEEPYQHLTSYRHRSGPGYDSIQILNTDGTVQAWVNLDGKTIVIADWVSVTQFPAGRMVEAFQKLMILVPQAAPLAWEALAILTKEEEEK